MIKAVDIQGELDKLPFLGLRGETTEAEAGAAFAELAKFRDGALFTGSFSGQSPWERHQGGDEIVQIIAGATKLTILTDEGPEVLELGAGMLTVVPEGCWHRFEAPDAVSVLTATPQPTDISFADDPRAEE